VLCEITKMVLRRLPTSVTFPTWTLQQRCSENILERYIWTPPTIFPCSVRPKHQLFVTREPSHLSRKLQMYQTGTNEYQV
jgi:hypothetical protein